VREVGHHNAGYPSHLQLSISFQLFGILGINIGFGIERFTRKVLSHNSLLMFLCLQATLIYHLVLLLRNSQS